MRSPTSRNFPASSVLGAIVVVLGVSIAGITWWLRMDLREQILRREGESLLAVSTMQQTLETDRTGGEQTTDDDDQLVLIALQISRLRGVLGVEVYDAQRRNLHSLPTILKVTTLTPTDWNHLGKIQPVVRYHPSASLDALYGLEDTPGENTPLLEITIPLLSPATTSLAGAACYVIEGQQIQREFSHLDRGLARQAGLVWLLASTVIVTGVGWVLGRLNQTHAALEKRTEDLIKANNELGLAAKTSALGAITAHLMHGLKNPIAGLEAFIDEQSNQRSSQETGAWSEANATTRRIRGMVNEVVELMQEEQSGMQYELTGREILETVSHRLATPIKAKHIQIELIADGSIRLSNRQAGLVTAILVNLTQNACDALSANEGKISLSAHLKPKGSTEFAVTDNGGGLPEDIAVNPFTPRQSRKPGGAGIGLVISQQLAVHLGGKLELVTTLRPGTSFRLTL